MSGDQPVPGSPAVGQPARV